MVECIVLDGWHKGHHVVMPEIKHQLSLLKPPTITIDDCCDGEVTGVDRDMRKDYQLAFVAQDRKVALYSTDGSSKAILQRDWIRPLDSNWKETPLYVSIHDPRAVIDSSTIEPNHNEIEGEK